MIKATTINKLISLSLLIIFISFGLLFLNTYKVQAYELTPLKIENVKNPGNLPFIHDEGLADLDPKSKHYGTIHNETGFRAFIEVLDFSIRTLIKLVGVMCLFGITEGLIRLIVGHGNEEIYGKGIKMVMWSIVGLALSLIAHAVVTGALQFLTGVGSLDI